MTRDSNFLALLRPTTGVALLLAALLAVSCGSGSTTTESTDNSEEVIAPSITVSDLETPSNPEEESTSETDATAPGEDIAELEDAASGVEDESISDADAETPSESDSEADISNDEMVNNDSAEDRESGLEDSSGDELETDDGDTSEEESSSEDSDNDSGEIREDADSADADEGESAEEDESGDPSTEGEAAGVDEDADREEVENEEGETSTEAEDAESEAVESGDDGSEDDNSENEGGGDDDSGDGENEDGESNDVVGNDDVVENPDPEEPPEPTDRTWARIQQRGVLRVAIDPSIGYTYLLTNAETQQYDGFEYEILEAIAIQLDISLELIQVPWEGQLSALADNRIDMIFGGREESMISGEDAPFLATDPYYQSPQHIVIHQDLASSDSTNSTTIGNASGPINHLSDLFGRKVGIVSNSTGAALIEVYNDNRGNAIRLFASSNPSELFEQLRQRELDAVIIDRPIAVAVISGLGALPDKVAPINGEPDNMAPESTDSRDADTEDNETPSGDIPLDSLSSAAVEDSEVLDLEVLDSEVNDSAVDGSSNEANTPFAEPSELVIVGEPLYPVPLVGVVRDDGASLKQAVDEAIEQLRESGTLAAIWEKWEL